MSRVRVSSPRKIISGITRCPLHFEMQHFQAFYNLLKIPPSGSQAVGEECQGAVPCLVEHLIVGSKTEDMEPIRAPRDHAGRGVEALAECFSASRRWVPA